MTKRWEEVECPSTISQICPQEKHFSPVQRKSHYDANRLNQTVNPSNEQTSQNKDLIFAEVNASEPLLYKFYIPTQIFYIIIMQYLMTILWGTFSQFQTSLWII